MARNTLLMAWILAACALVGAACASRVPNPSIKPGDHIERTPPLSGHWTIEEARRFDDFSLYWVGEELRGLPITDIVRFDSSSKSGVRTVAENKVIFMYGTCEPPGGAFADGGCSPPIQIIAEPYCAKSGLYADKVPYRGAGARSQAIDTEAGMYVWTGDVAVKIYAYGASGGPMAVADALVSLNGRGPSSPNEPLPAASVDC